MATAARKARKRAGIKFEKAEKIPTPVMERSYIREAVQGPPTTKHAGRFQPRSQKKIDRFIGERTLNLV